MAISRAAGFPVNQNVTGAVTLVNSGDLIAVSVGLTSNTGSVTSITDSSSRVTWDAASIVVDSDSGNNVRQEIWKGVSTSSGSTTITINVGGGGSLLEWMIDELHDGSSPTWAVVTSSFKNNPSGTTVTWPTLTSGSSPPDQAYLGFTLVANNWNSGSASAGFSDVQTGKGNGYIWDLSLSTSTGYSPTGSQAPGGWSDCTGVIFSASAAGAPAFYPFKHPNTAALRRAAHW